MGLQVGSTVVVKAKGFAHGRSGKIASRNVKPYTVVFSFPVDAKEKGYFYDDELRQIRSYEEIKAAKPQGLFTGNVPPGTKDDDGKLPVDLLPFDALEKVSRILAYGAKKYAPDNWRKVPNGTKRYTAAALRHLFSFMKGEIKDKETGMPHLWHAACNVLFAISLEE